jgi:glyoxylase-like metal-dependent hydrolase (beta-lactamase superfamily II)
LFEEIAKQTYMLRVDERVCSTIYMIEADGKRLLIDSGDGKVKFDFTPDVCILTHGHYDHTSGVKEGWKTVLLHEAEFAFGGPYIKIPKNAQKNAMKPMKFGGHELEFFHTPGHTDGSICIFDKTTGVLFSGDTKFADGNYGRTDLGGSDEKIEQSLKRIGKIPYKLLCAGHGQLEPMLSSFRANARNSGATATENGEIEERE